MTSKEYMQGVTVVEPSWLAEAGPMIYSLRVTENVTSSGSFTVPSRKVINYSDVSSPLRLGSIGTGHRNDSVDSSKRTSAVEKDVGADMIVVPGKKSRGSSNLKRNVDAEM
mgnify:CR=1 FL=1